jgi:hypothetical protein
MTVIHVMLFPSCRNQTACQRRRQGHTKRVQEQREIHADIVNAWNPRRRGSEKQPQACGRESHRKDTSESGDNQCLRHLQADQLPARRTDRAPHGKLALPPFGANHEQVGNVRASDQEDHADSCQQQISAAPPYALIKPARQCIVVVFPEPFGPI